MNLSRPLAPDNSFSPNFMASSDLRTESSSSFESVRTKGYMQTVRNSMEDLKCPQAMEHAEYQARKMIQSLENAPEEDGGKSPNLYSNPAVPDVDVRLHKVLEAMLANAEACGGSHGKRYTIASICSAGRSSKSNDELEDDVQSLRNLGVTWLSHFLWVFKANHPSYLSNARMCPSQISTRINNDPTPWRHSNGKLFRNLVRERDDYQCCVTGWYDEKKPNLSPDVSDTRYLDACRITRRVVEPLEESARSDVTKSSKIIAEDTFDIIRNYYNIPRGEVECLTTNVDDPQNGFLLQYDAHKSFDHFDWCLHPAETGHKNEYKVKQYNRRRSGIGGTDVPPIIVRFEDHSGNYISNEDSDVSESLARELRGNTTFTRVARGVPVPNPLFFRIHAGVAGVLHMSGAAEVIDLVLKRFQSIGPAGDIFTAEDFESPGLVDLKESIQNLRLGEAYYA